MSTVLVIEDQFLVSYELECALKDRGYNVRHAATQGDALTSFHRLHATGDLAAIICDNRLIDGSPAAASLYQQVRAISPVVPFIVYSGFPPEDLPADDPHLRTVRKPNLENVISLVGSLALSRGKSRAFEVPLHGREAA